MPVGALLKAISDNDIDTALTILEAEPHLINHYFETGTTALHEAIRCGHAKLAYKLIQKGADVNQLTRAPATLPGVTPLMTAIWNKQLSSIQALMKSGQKLRLDSATLGGHNALTNAIDQFDPEIFPLVFNLPGAKELLDVKRKVAPQESALDLLIANPGIRKRLKGMNSLSYKTWLKGLRKMPSKSLFSAYLQELMEKKTKKGLMKKRVLSQKLWTDMVSDTNRVNENYKENNDVQNSVISRLKDLGYPQPEEVYNACLNYLKNCPIVMSFDAAILGKKELDKKELESYQALNVFETSTDKQYKESRKAVEDALFQGLTESSDLSYGDRYKTALSQDSLEAKQEAKQQDNLRSSFLADEGARPRYAKLELLDGNHSIHALKGYGKSFVVFRNVVNLNSLFLPSNPFFYHRDHKKDYVPATYIQQEVFLHQCTDERLKALAERVTTGFLSEDYDSDKGSLNGYITVLLPGVDLFNPDLIEHIHVDSDEYLLKDEDIKTLEARGMNVSNKVGSPYPQLSKQFMRFIIANKIDKVEHFLKRYPSLLNSVNPQGKTPIEIALLNNHFELFKILQAKGGILSTAVIEKAFYNVVKKNDLKKLDQLRKLKLQFDPNKQNGKNKYTALHYAIKSNQVDLVKELLKFDNIQVKIPDANNLSPLELAASEGNLAAVNILLPLTDPAVLPAAIHYADEKEHTLIVWLLALHNLPRDIQNPDRQAAIDTLISELKKLCEEGKLKLAEEKAKDFILLDKDAQQLLHSKLFVSFIIDNKIDEVEHLLKRYPSLLNSINPQGKTPIEIAFLNNHFDLFKIFQAKGGILPTAVIEKAFYNAVKENDLEKLEQLRKLELQFDPNKQKGNNKYTALHYAIKSNQVDLVKELLKFDNIQVKIPDANNLSPLELAASEGNLAAVSILLPLTDPAVLPAAMNYADEKKHTLIAWLLELHHLPRDIQNPDRQAAIDRLKTQAYPYASLEKQCVAFSKLDAFINEIINKQPNSKYPMINDLIQQFKENINLFYLHDIDNLEEAYQELKTQTTHFQKVIELMLMIHASKDQAHPERQIAINTLISELKKLFVEGKLQLAEEKAKDFILLDKDAQQLLQYEKQYFHPQATNRGLLEKVNIIYSLYSNKKSSARELDKELLKIANIPITMPSVNKSCFFGRKNRAEEKFNEVITSYLNQRKLK